jgi:hypothetical protein
MSGLENLTAKVTKKAQSAQREIGWLYFVHELIILPKALTYSLGGTKL